MKNNKLKTILSLCEINNNISIEIINPEMIKGGTNGCYKCVTYGVQDKCIVKFREETPSSTL